MDANEIDKDVETAARELAGNWKKFDSFGWSSDARPDDAENCAIVNLSHRDSGLLDKSNEAAILEELKPFTGWMHDPIDGASFDVETQSHGHWAVGHVNAIVIRCTRDGAPTEAFKVFHGLMMALADYPCLDESDLSERECEAESEAWESYGARDFRSELAALADDHEELLRRVPGDHLFTIWRAIAEKRLGGSTCEHEGDGVYFPFDYALKRMSWADVRRVFLDVKADQAPQRLAAKIDARLRAEKGESATNR